MNRFAFLFNFILLMSACGNANSHVEEQESMEEIDTIHIAPTSPNDTANLSPIDTFIVNNNIHPKDTTLADSFFINDKPEIEYSKLFRLTSPSRNYTQGIAIYDKYLFNCHHSNDIIDVFNLETQKAIAYINLEPDNLIHCNNVNFGSEFYSKEDRFPILYIQQRGYTRKLNAYRIICSGDSIMTAEKVQTITFEACSSCINAIDIKNNLLYSIYEYKGGKYISTLPMPSVKEGDICINLRSALKTYYSPYTKVGQDTAFDKKYLYVICGNKNEGELWRIDINNKIAKVIDLTKYGMLAEPEGIDIYKDFIMVSFLNSPIYNIKFLEQ